MEQNQQPPNQQNNNQPMPPMMPGAHKSRYSAFFLVMLILASIGAFFSFFGMFTSVFDIVTKLNENRPLEALASGFSIMTTLVGLSALVLLYMKKKAGFVLKMVAIGLSLAVSIFTVVVTKNNFYNDFHEALYSRVEQGSATTEEEQVYRDVDGFLKLNGANLFLALGIILPVLSSAITILLWSLAWRSQQKHDAA